MLDRQHPAFSLGLSATHFGRSRGLYAVIGALFAAVGWLDFNTPLGLVLWLLYLAPIWLLSRVTPFDHRLVMAGAFTTTGLMAASFLFSASSLLDWKSAVNRSIGGILVWIVSLLLIRARRQEESIRLNEARARCLVAASAQVLWIAEPDGRVVQDSPTWEAFTGQTAEARKGWGWLQVVHPDDRPRVERQWRAAVSSRRPLEAEYRLRDRQGDYRWTSVRAVPLLDAAGSVAEWLGMHADITERKRNEEALRDSEELFRANFDLAAVGQAQVQAQTGRFIRVNDRFCDITGYRREELLELTPQDLTHPEDRQPDDRAIRRFLRGECEEYHVEKRYCRKDGDLRWVQVSARLIRDAGGKPLRTIAVIEDITARKEADAALVRLTKELERRVAERTKQLTESQQRLRALASELNLTEQRERRRLAADLHDYLAQLLVVGRMKLSQALNKPGGVVARRPVEEAEDILDQALTYTRSLVSQLVPPVLEQFGLAAALSWLADQMCRHGLTVAVRVPQETPALNVDDAALMYQSVRELLMNVVKHANTSEAMVTLEYEEGRVLTVRVHDEGVGFVESAGIATDKFGLFSIRERMHVLGGELAIESSPGQGTTATLLLPLKEKPDDRPALKIALADERREDRLAVRPTGAKAGSQKERIKVVLVDDHAMVREGLKSILMGYPDIDVVGEAGHGEEAVALAGQVAPHVMVMDVNMPKMDGIEATRRITCAYPGIIVIGLSVNATAQVAEGMRVAGALTLLTKESAAESLYHTIKQAAAKPDRLSSQVQQESLPFS